ncbi:MAG: substrate-binding domain-containing protein, partial [Pseudomonadota bacterium]
MRLFQRHLIASSLILLGLLLFASSCSKQADDATIAVATNFRPALEKLAWVFQAETGYEIEIVSNSTGKLYAQILNGAPFDVFLAADQERP